MEIGIYCCLTADILTKVLQKCSLSSPFLAYNGKNENWHLLLSYCRYLFLLLLLMYGCYGHLKFPLTCNGKNENWHLLLSYYRYFGEKKIRNVYWMVLYQTYNFSPNPISLVVMAVERLNLLKIFNQINSSEAVRVIKLKLFRNIHGMSLYKNECFSLLMLMHFNCCLIVGILTELY